MNIQDGGRGSIIIVFLTKEREDTDYRLVFAPNTNYSGIEYRKIDLRDKDTWEWLEIGEIGSDDIKNIEIEKNIKSARKIIERKCK